MFPQPTAPDFGDRPPVRSRDQTRRPPPRNLTSSAGMDGLGQAQPTPSPIANAGAWRGLPPHLPDSPYLFVMVRNPDQHGLNGCCTREEAAPDRRVTRRPRRAARPSPVRDRYFIRSWILAMAARAHSSSKLPPGAPLTPIPAIVFPPAMIATPPTA